MKGKNSVTVKLGENLIAKLIEIQNQEAERGRDKTSFREAGEILSMRIDLAGGLKPVGYQK